MFTLYDLRKQLAMARSPEVIQRMMLMPGLGELREVILNDQNLMTMIGQQIGTIDSMTLSERHNPKIINLARRNRIARGAGVQVPVVNEVIRMFETMASMLNGPDDDEEEE